MKIDPAVLFLLLFFLLVLPLPEVSRSLAKVPVSLRYFLGGVLGLLAMAAAWNGPYSARGWEVRLLLVMFLFAPLWFTVGARRSLEELKGRAAKWSRWLNVAGFVLSLALFTMLVFYGIRRESLVPWAIFAVAEFVVLAFSRVVLWRPPPRSRWARFLPGYPAILLAPLVLVLWALDRILGEGFSISAVLGFPLLFHGEWEWPSTPRNRLLVAPAVLDLLIAVVAIWPLAWGADRLVLSWVLPGREKPVLRRWFGWTRYLPGFPAALLVPAVLALWAWLCSVREIGPRLWVGRWGVPLPFYGEPSYRVSVQRFHLGVFLVDLAIALATGWIMALVFDRLVFPAIRGARGRRARPDEAD